MTTPLDSKLVERFLTRIDEEDAKSIETMASGMLQSFDEYRFAAGYRKALRDAKTLINETFEDLMKE
jgi:hypothetical protein